MTVSLLFHSSYLTWQFETVWGAAFVNVTARIDEDANSYLREIAITCREAFERSDTLLESV